MRRPSNALLSGMCAAAWCLVVSFFVGCRRCVAYVGSVVVAMGSAPARRVPLQIAAEPTYADETPFTGMHHLVKKKKNGKSND